MSIYPYSYIFLYSFKSELEVSNSLRYEQLKHIQRFRDQASDRNALHLLAAAFTESNI